MAGGFKGLIKPIAKRVLHTTIEPVGPARWLYAAAFKSHWVGREVYDWGLRSLVATPMLLSRCAVHGERISIDRIPYLEGVCRIEIGSDVRISGQLTIKASSRTKNPVVKIGNGVFIGHNVMIGVNERIEIGNYVGIGGGSFITDSDGHTRDPSGDRPVWELPPSAEAISPVIIEDAVWIGRNCSILRGVRIGARSTLGIGTVVRSDLPADAVVAGNPARVVPKNLFGAKVRAAE